MLLMYAVFNNREIGAKTDKNEDERVQRAKLQAEAAERSLLIIVSYPVLKAQSTENETESGCFESLNYLHGFS